MTHKAVSGRKSLEAPMGNKIVTEADRKRTPAPKVVEGYKITKEGTGQRISRERGSATRSKKNPGKRAHKGGS
jgi:hypothetical protein